MLISGSVFFGLNEEGVRVHHIPYAITRWSAAINVDLHGLPSQHTSLFRSLLLSLRLDIFGLVCERTRVTYCRNFDIERWAQPVQR